MVCGVWWWDTINSYIGRTGPATPSVMSRSVVQSSAGERERTVWAEPQLVGEPREDRMMAGDQTEDNTNTETSQTWPDNMTG